MHFVLALATLITDESVRLRVLEAIFPKMHITATPTRSIDASWQFADNRNVWFDDAFKHEAVYRVTGPPRSEADLCAARDIISDKLSHVREVRFQVFPWPAEAGHYAVAAQYEYIGANPPMACTSIARLYRVGPRGVAQEETFHTTRHRRISRFELIDLSGDGVAELLIEADYGGGGFRGSVLRAYELKSGKLIKRFEAHSISLDWQEPLEFTQVLDIDRTRATAGAKFCFTRTTYVEKAVRFAEPRVTYPCYKAN